MKQPSALPVEWARESRYDFCRMVKGAGCPRASRLLVDSDVRLADGDVQDFPFCPITHYLLARRIAYPGRPRQPATRL